MIYSTTTSLFRKILNPKSFSWLVLIPGFLFSSNAPTSAWGSSLTVVPSARRDIRVNSRLSPVDPRLLASNQNFWCNYQASDPTRQPILVPYSQFSAQGMLRQVRANASAVNEMLRGIYPTEFAAAGLAVREVPYSVSDAAVLEIGDHQVDPGFVGINNGLSSGGSYVVGRHRSTLVDGALKDYQQLILRPTPAYNTSALIIGEVHRLGTSTWGPDTLEYIRVSNSYPQSTEIELLLKPSSCQPGMLEVQFAMRLNTGRLTGARSEWAKPRDEVSLNCMVLHLLKSVRGRRDFVRRKVFDLAGGVDSIVFRDGFLLYDGIYECTTPLGY